MWPLGLYSSAFSGIFASSNSAGISGMQSTNPSKNAIWQTVSRRYLIVSSSDIVIFWCIDHYLLWITSMFHIRLFSPCKPPTTLLIILFCSFKREMFLKHLGKRFLLYYPTKSPACIFIRAVPSDELLSAVMDYEGK